MLDNIETAFSEANRQIGKKAFIVRKALYAKARKGEIGAKEHYNILSRITHVPPQILERAFTDSYLKALQPNKDVLRLVEKLKQNGYKAAMISNMTPMTKRIASKLEIFRKFSPVVLSCDVKCMKPERKIFEVALRRIKLKPGECIFIDDKKEMLDTSARMGMKTIKFKNARQLAAELRGLNSCI